MSEALTTESATIALPTPKVEADSNLQHLLNHLADEGFRPKIDDDGSIGFKCEGWKLYLDPYPNQGGFRLYCCVYWELDPVDRTKALNVANEINADRRCVKAVVNGNNNVRTASINAVSANDAPPPAVSMGSKTTGIRGNFCIIS